MPRHSSLGKQADPLGRGSGSHVAPKLSSWVCDFCAHRVVQLAGLVSLPRKTERGYGWAGKSGGGCK